MVIQHSLLSRACLCFGLVLAGALSCAYAQVAPSHPATTAVASSVPLPAARSVNWPNVAAKAAPDVDVPATPRSLTPWEAKARQIMAKRKKALYENYQKQMKAVSTEETAQSMRDIATKSEDIIKHPQKYAGGDWQAKAESQRKAVAKASKKQLEAIAKQAPSKLKAQLDKAAAAMGLPPPSVGAMKAMQKQAARDRKQRVKYRLFVSQSMGDDGLRKAMNITKHHPRMEMVFRGPKKGQTVYQLSKYLISLYKTPPKRGDLVPNIVVNPVPFEDDHIKTVPVLEQLDPDGHVVAKVTGLADPTWIDDQVDHGRKGDLGKMGPTYPVVEFDLLKAFKKKAQSVHVKKLANKAVDDFWKKQTFINLPPAREEKSYTVDPTVVVTRNIVLPDGRVIAHKGDKYNPLESIGFHQKLLIFDETDPDQVAYAAKFLKENPVTTVMLITSRVDRKKGWSGYRDTENKLHHAVYLLNGRVLSTWKLKAVPSVVTAQGSVFVVKEVPVHHGGSNVVDHATSR